MGRRRVATRRRSGQARPVRKDRDPIQSRSWPTFADPSPYDPRSNPSAEPVLGRSHAHGRFRARRGDSASVPVRGDDGGPAGASAAPDHAGAGGPGPRRWRGGDPGRAGRELLGRPLDRRGRHQSLHRPPAPAVRDRHSRRVLDRDAGAHRLPPDEGRGAGGRRWRRTRRACRPAADPRLAVRGGRRPDPHGGGCGVAGAGASGTYPAGRTHRHPAFRDVRLRSLAEGVRGGARRRCVERPREERPQGHVVGRGRAVERLGARRRRRQARRQLPAGRSGPGRCPGPAPERPPGRSAPARGALVGHLHPAGEPGAGDAGGGGDQDRRRAPLRPGPEQFPERPERQRNPGHLSARLRPHARHGRAGPGARPAPEGRGPAAPLRPSMVQLGGGQRDGGGQPAARPGGAGAQRRARSRQASART